MSADFRADADTRFDQYLIVHKDHRPEDEVIVDILTRIWRNREDRYSELRELDSNERPLMNKIEMYRMGG